MNIVPLILLCILYFYGGILLYITLLAKKEGEQGAFLNNLAVTLVLLSSLTVNIFITTFFAFIYEDFIVFPFDILTLLFIIGFVPFFGLLIRREKKKFRSPKIKSPKKQGQMNCP